MVSLREVSAPGAPMSPLAFQVATDNLEIPRGKMLEKSSFVSGAVSAFLLSGGLSFGDIFGEDFADCIDGEAESLGGDRFPDGF